MRKWTAFAVVAAVAALVCASAAFADGTETLGPPSVTVATGTDVVAAGVGMEGYSNLPNSFGVNVPGTVKQVLLYWEGHWTAGGNDAHPAQVDGAPVISVNSNSVIGTKIGGSTTFFGQSSGPAAGDENFVTYRADITGLDLVHTGANTLTIDNMSFESNFPFGNPFVYGNDGAGVLVVYDDGTSAKTIAIRDGNDLAYFEFAPTLDTTVPQTFAFASSTTPRTATLSTLAGSVLGPDTAPPRANQLSITFDVGAPVVLDDPWQSTQGYSWDALNSPIVIPAGASSMTVQALSAGTSGKPAS